MRDRAYLIKRKGDIYEDITTNFERKSYILVTIATMLQFGIFLIALIGLVIKLIDLSQKKPFPTFARVRMVKY
jgi:hypothetical protein